MNTNSMYHSNLTLPKIINAWNLNSLDFLYFSLIYLHDFPCFKSRINIKQAQPLCYKLSSTLSATLAATTVTGTVYKPVSTSNTSRSLHKGALGLQVNRAWSLNTFSNLASTGLTSEPIIAHDGNVPLIFFSSIDSKSEFSFSNPLLVYENLSNGVSSSLKRVKHYLTSKNRLALVNHKNVVTKMLDTACSKQARLSRSSIKNRLRYKRNNRLRYKRRKLYLKTLKSATRLNFTKLRGKYNQGRLSLIYAKSYHSLTSSTTRPVISDSLLVKPKVGSGDLNLSSVLTPTSSSLNTLLTHEKLAYKGKYYTNVHPDSSSLRTKLRKFSPQLTRQLNFYPDITPWVTDTLVRLIEACAGKRAIVQHNMNVEHMVESQSKLLYRLWIIRMAYYERTLGHRFFMEEALHIMHLSLRFHDVKLFSSWLKAIITRISFWKTRSIFRFLKYVFNNYYRYMFDSLSVKGIKIRLKGKISAAGNSRKRTIIFRSGQNSYSSVNVKCLHEFKTITTFTGVMGFQVWLFY